MNAPKGKADMKEFEEYYLCFEREYRNTVAPIDTPDEKKYFKMFWQAASAASRTDTLKEILEALPLDSRIDSSVMDESSMTFARHQNYWLNEIRAIIEKKLESV